MTAEDKRQQYYHITAGSVPARMAILNKNIHGTLVIRASCCTTAKSRLFIVRYSGMLQFLIVQFEHKSIPLRNGRSFFLQKHHFYDNPTSQMQKRILRQSGRNKCRAVKH